MTATQQDMVARQAGSVERPTTSAAAGSTRQSPLVPLVSIFEDPDQITVQADMPGVAKEGLDVRIDRNTLTIQGEVAIAMPAGMTALYADLHRTRYQRSFALSGELDTEHIAAGLKDGVLTVRIPKRIEYRARKIPVTVA